MQTAQQTSAGFRLSPPTRVYRILFCIPNMAGGGAERQLVYLAGELVSRGWDVHVALTGEGPNYDALVATGCRIHKIPCRGNHDIMILVRLVSLIGRIKPHIVQTWMRQMDVLGGIASRMTGVPFIVSERSSSSAYPSTIKHRMRLSVGRLAEAVIANSSGGSEYWRMAAGLRVPTCIIDNGLPLTEIDKAVPSPCDVDIPPGSKVVLFAGRFSPNKNIGTIIDAFEIVSSRKDAFLCLCGEGELRPRIEETVRERGLESRVFLPGYVRNVWELMKLADLFVSVSHYEGRPNTVLEAMACSCPLILSDIPAHRDFLHDGEALFVDPGSASDIARAIVTCIEDPETGRKMALRARMAVSSYSISAMADQYENRYRNILTGRFPKRN